jgi:Ni/Fe-hydrogenase subunit HybB-like protein
MLQNLRSKFVVTPWVIWLGVMGLILLSGAVAGILVFWKGLGITNLSDYVPWGLWITIDLSSIALGAGACAQVFTCSD